MVIIQAGILHSQTPPAEGMSSYLAMGEKEGNRERRKKEEKEAQTLNLKKKFYFWCFHNMHQVKLHMFCDSHLNSDII